MFKVKLIFCYHILIHWCALDISKANPLYGNTIVRADDNEFPFVVSIGTKIDSDGEPGHHHFCTGSLISKEHVLTAEHCFEGINLENVQVSLGSTDSTNGEIYGVDHLVTFEDWARIRKKDIKFKDNDMAILRLVKQVDDPLVNPAVLSFKNSTELYEKDAMTAGWGITNSGQIARYMKKAKLHIIKYVDCMEHVKEIVGKRIIIPKNFLCTLTTLDALIQSGDSGGPLFIDNEIIAINGATFPKNKRDNDPNVQNMHVQLYYYKDFIREILCSWVAPDSPMANAIKFLIPLKKLF